MGTGIGRTVSAPLPDFASTHHPTAANVAHRVVAGRYELDHVLGEGGMATVWAARDLRLGRVVAVKLLRHEVTADHARRIEREARAAARIGDPRVVTVLDLDHDDDGTPFLVLEALGGRTLADELRDGPLPTERAMRLADDLLGALGAAHRCGVLHRDVKPANVLVADGGFRISDFGIATVADETATNGDLVGTLLHMAPERFESRPATSQSDVFSAGAVLYETFTGRQPFRRSDMAESLVALRAGHVEPLPAHVPTAVADAITRSLDADPTERPADADAFAHLLHGCVDDPTEPIDVGLRATTPSGDRTEVLGAPVPAQPPSPAHDRRSVFETEPARAARVSPAGRLQRLRRPQVVFVAVAAALLGVLLLAVAVGDRGRSSDPAPPVPDDADPAGLLEANLERIEELGR
jgi:serine/threonine protein kinase